MEGQDEKKKRFLIDPPSGWKYGFPKVVDELYKTEEDIKKQLLDLGYPKEELDRYIDYLPIQVTEIEE